eukprot:CAMPEP_0203663090 /NCGR_PEP_ID=MMETSP0090-20130426/817_1 /ASSEMBLY_ACC=CAM_ASM_001088 /TAXON_ID=426623 /ORGANISM="Chaetoceros affinis, Strain CCMP159" /LENGTH=680 /DNA_ID=CAMNT_0050525957 /DNA_START=201 /DNA_END=2243 /DNA_ORIENTATION=-
MDFSKQLANLARAASNSNSSNSNNREGSSNNNHRGGGNGGRSGHYHNNRHSSRHNDRYNPYPRHAPGRRNHHHDRGQLTPAEQEFYLPKLIEAIPKFNPVVGTSQKKDKRRHVALLFITIDDLPFEHVWRAFLNNYQQNGTGADTDGDLAGGVDGDVDDAAATTTSYTFSSSSLIVSVLCHAKYPENVRSEWLRQRLLVSNPPPNNNRQNNNNNNYNSRHNNRNNRNNTNNYHRQNDDRQNNNNNNSVRYHTRRPEWGSIDITRAMIDLLNEGLKIGTMRDRSTMPSGGGTTCSNTHTSSSSSKNDTSTLTIDPYSTSRYISSDHDQSNSKKNTNSNNINSSSSSSKSSSAPLYATGRSTSSSEKIPTVDRFIFVSESCLPVVTLEELEVALFGPDGSSNNFNNIAHANNQKYTQRGGPQHKHHHQQQRNQHDISTNQGIEGGTKAGNYSHNHYNGENANKSWLKAINKPNNGYAKQQQWDATKPAIPQKFIHKADQWIALTRHHAWPMISLIDDAVKSVQQKYPRTGYGNGERNSRVKVALWQCFQNVKASDEIYFPTTMALLGILGTAPEEDGDNNGNTANDYVDEAENSRKDEIAFKRLTYCDWSESARNPASFVVNRQQDPEFKELRTRIDLARDEGCLFARKFTGGHGFADERNTISVQEWTNIIHGAIDKSNVK